MCHASGVTRSVPCIGLCKQLKHTAEVNESWGTRRKSPGKVFWARGRAHNASTLEWQRADLAALLALRKKTTLVGIWAWRSREDKQLEWLGILAVSADFLSENPWLYLAVCQESVDDSHR